MFFRQNPVRLSKIGLLKQDKNNRGSFRFDASLGRDCDLKLFQSEVECVWSALFAEKCSRLGQQRSKSDFEAQIDH